MPQIKGRKKEQIVSYFVFGFIQAFDWADGSPRVRKGCLIYSVYLFIQKKLSQTHRE